MALKFAYGPKIYILVLRKFKLDITNIQGKVTLEFIVQETSV